MESYHNHTALVQSRRTFGFEAVDSAFCQDSTIRTKNHFVAYYIHGELPFSLYGAGGVPDLDRSRLFKASPRKESPAAKSGFLGRIASSPATRDFLQHFRSKFHPLSFVFDSPHQLSS